MLVELRAPFFTSRPRASHTACWP